MLTSLAGRRADRQTTVDQRIAALAREAEDADERLRRLYKLVEVGLAQMDELLRDRISTLKLGREAAMAALDRARTETHPTDHVSPLAVDRFARVMRERLTTGAVPFRKAYLGSIVDRIEVDDAPFGSWAEKRSWNKRFGPTRPTRPRFTLLYQVGEPGGDRTRDHMIKSHVLYR